MVNLLSNFLQMQSDILGWIDSYRLLVERVGSFLFGWIDLWWIDVTPLEMHASLLAVLIFRSLFSESVARAGLKGYASLATNYMITPILLSLLLPSPLGVVVVLWFTISTAGHVVGYGGPEESGSVAVGRFFEVISTPFRSIGQAFDRMASGTGVAESAVHVDALWVDDLNRDDFLHHLQWSFAILVSLVITDQAWLQALD